MANRPCLRWALVREPKGELDTQALLGTDQTVASTRIAEWFVLHWRLVVTC